MIVCKVCALPKPLDNFSVKNRKTGQRNLVCKPCFTVYSRAYYAKHREKYSDHRRQNLPLYRERNKQFITNYLSTHPCVDCGENDIVVLEFDHVAGVKKEAIAEMVGAAASIRRLVSEIAKCVVRCANCHRRKTVAGLGWYRMRLLPNDASVESFSRKKRRGWADADRHALRLWAPD